MTDRELLAAYVERADEGAFGEVVRRHIDVVYGAAVRRVRDPGMAEDVAQAVFIVLARRAKVIREGGLLVAWLLKVTRHCAADAQKIAARRRVREERVAAMAKTVSDGVRDMEIDLTPVLDGGLDALGEADRTAVVLRYLEERSLAEVGAALGISEEAAKKRVARAVEKLRKIFAGKGVMLSAGLVAGAMAKQMVGAPVGLAEKVAAGAIAKGVEIGAGAVIAKGVIKGMLVTTVKIAAGVAAAMVVVAAGTVGVVMKSRGGERKVDEVAVATSSADETTMFRTPVAVTRPGAGGVYSILGNLKRPGTYALPAAGSITLRQALNAAGVNANYAEDMRVVIVRRTDLKNAETIDTVNVARVLDGTTNLDLKGNDVLNVQWQIMGAKPAEQIAPKLTAQIDNTPMWAEVAMHVVIDTEISQASRVVTKGRWDVDIYRQAVGDKNQLACNGTWQTIRPDGSIDPASSEMFTWVSGRFSSLFRTASLEEGKKATAPGRYGNIDGPRFNSFSSAPDMGWFLDGTRGNDDFHPRLAVLLQSSIQTILPKELIEGVECVMIESATRFGRARAWVAPSNGGRLLKYEIVSRAGDIGLDPEVKERSEMLDQVVVEKIEGIYVPTHGRYQVVITKIDGSQGRMDLIATRSAIRIRPDFSALNAFVPKLPEGTPLIDGNAKRKGQVKFEFRGGRVVDRLTGEVVKDALQ